MKVYVVSYKYSDSDISYISKIFLSEESAKHYEEEMNKFSESIYYSICDYDVEA